MTNSSPIHYLLLISTLLVGVYCIKIPGKTPESLFETTSQLLRLRGFQAIDHNVTVTGGWILNLVQAFSPIYEKSTIRKKSPVLFIHGLYNSGNTWLLNSIGSRPRNYSRICGAGDEKKLLQYVKSDPGLNSVPITFMNCGREVWILNRRGNKQSRGYSNPDLAPYDDPITNYYQTLFGGRPSLMGFLESFKDSLLEYLFTNNRGYSISSEVLQEPFSPRFWNFSLDDEAKYDIPEVMEYIREKTKQPKLNIVGHSAGGEVTLMSQVIKPELAYQIDKTLLYAPAMYLSGSVGAIYAPLLPKFVSYLGQSFPNFALSPIHLATESFCRNSLTQYTICSIILQMFFGQDAFSELVRPEYADSILDSTSSHVAAQLVQTTVKGKTHYFDYMDSDRNRIAYGQSTPPVYNVSKIISQPIAIWYGNSDPMVPADSVRHLIRDMSVPVEEHFIDSIGMLWNHMSFFYDNDKIPSYLTISSVEFLESSSSV